MAETKEVIDGVLTVTKTSAPIIEILSKDDIVGKRAEAQTKVDHLKIDLDAAKAEVAKLDAYLVDINNAVIPK